jgi:hypothetical protein
MIDIPRTPATPGAPAANAFPGGGTRLVVGLLALAVALASFAVWFQWRQTRRCLAFYGAEQARRIQSSPRVELWSLANGGVDGREPPDDSDGKAHCGSPERLDLRPSRRLDVSRAKGLVHLRRGLVEDANFAQKAIDSGTGEGCWDVALAFFDTESAAVPECVVLVAFAPPTVDGGPGAVATPGRLAILGRPATLALGRIEAGLRTWIDATLAAHSGGTAWAAPPRDASPPQDTGAQESATGTDLREIHWKNRALAEPRESLGFPPVTAPPGEPRSR